VLALLDFMEWLRGLGAKKPPCPGIRREYIVQVRTRNQAGGWTSWSDYGEALTEAQADEWLRLKGNNPGSAWVEHRMVMIPVVL